MAGMRFDDSGTLADDLNLLRCSACGVTLLVDPVAGTVRLHHLPDGAHRVIGPTPAPGPVLARQADSMVVRAGVLGVAIRLRDLADDLDNVLAELSGVDRQG